MRENLATECPLILWDFKVCFGPIHSRLIIWNFRSATWRNPACALAYDIAYRSYPPPALLRHAA